MAEKFEPIDIVGKELYMDTNPPVPSLAKTGTFYSTVYRIDLSDENDRVGILDMFPFRSDGYDGVAKTDRIGRLLVSVPEADEAKITALVTSRLRKTHPIPVEVEVERTPDFEPVDWSARTTRIINYDQSVTDAELTAHHETRLRTAGPEHYRQLGASSTGGISLFLDSLTESARANDPS